MQWWETKTCCEKRLNKNMVDRRERDKKLNMQMMEEWRKIKYGITTDLFSRREHHILGLWVRPSPYLKI
jgi:hypothetical protein